MAKTSRTFAVIGLGAFGTAIAAELMRFGAQVVGIDRDEKRVNQLAPLLPATMILDASDEMSLREAGIDQYQAAIVAIGTDIEASILAVMNLRMLGIPKIWAKAQNRTHHRILSKLGADRVILPEREMGQHIAQMLNNPVVQDYVSLGNGFSVVNIEIPPHLTGRTVGSLHFGDDGKVRPLGLMRGTNFYSCDDGSQEMQAEDKLIVLGSRANLRRFGDTL